MEKIKLLTRISYLLVTLLCGLFAFEHIYKIYQLEIKLVNQKLHSVFNNLKEDLDQEVVNARSSLRLMESVINLKIDERVPLNQENLRPIMVPLLASRKNQHNLYFALEPEYAEKFFKEKGIIFSIHKNEAEIDERNYNNVHNFKLNEFTNSAYQQDTDWYLVGKQSRDVQTTDVYYDKYNLKVWMFSFIKGLYKDGKFRGVVGVDFIIDRFLKNMSSQTNSMHGALALVDNKTGKLFTHPDQKSSFDFSGFKPRYIGKDIINSSVKNSKDGKKYLVNSYPLKAFNWTVVTAISQEYIYAEVFSKVQFLLVLCFIALLFNLFIVYFLFRYLNRFYFDIITQNQSRGIVRLTEGLCHEINNPLATLSLCQVALKRLLKNEVNNSAINGLMSKSEKASERIRLIIQKLQNISFATSEVEFKAASMADIVEELKMIFSEDLSRYQISMNLEASEGGIIVCDPLKMLQVFMPLMENSIEEIKDLEHRWIKIEVDRTKNGNAICFVDSGHGVKKGIQERIFLPFFTTKIKEMKKGLGLTVAKSLIEQQGGTISYLEFAKNTTFKILLPLMPQVRS